MATHADPIAALTKPNVGVYTDPAHKLWVADSSPSLEEVKAGESLKEGEVTVGIKSTGICGYFFPLLSQHTPPPLTFVTAQTFTSGTLAASAPWSLRMTTSSATNPLV